MRFAYYNRLSAREKATYRKSDAVSGIDLPDAPALVPLVAELEAALTTGKRLATAKAVNALVLALCRQLHVPPVRVTVRLVRPEYQGGELHGLYTFAEAGSVPTIEVWMKTAAHKRVVRFRAFLRTLLHEVAHHLDVTLLGFTDSFHTQGFFRRESSLFSQLVSTPPKKDAKTRSEPEQLGLFGGKQGVRT